MRRLVFADFKAGAPQAPQEPALTLEWEGGSGALSLYLFQHDSHGYAFERAADLLGEGPALASDELRGIEASYLSISPPFLKFRLLKAPFSDREKLKEIIPFELDGLIMDGLDSIVFDVVVLGGSEGNFEVLVSYVQRRTLQELLAKIHSLGLDPMVITSIDLRMALEGGMDDIARRLVAFPLEEEPGMRVVAAVEEISAPTINLRVGPFAYTKEAKKRERALRVTLVLSLSLILLLHIDLGFRTVRAWRETSSMKKEMRADYLTLFPKEKTVSDELYLIRSHAKEIREKGNALADIDPLELLREFSQRMVEGITLFEISATPELITLKGEANSMDDVEKLKIGLRDVLRDISISEIKPSSGGRFFFTALAKGRS